MLFNFKTLQELQTFERRFWNHVDRSGGADACWWWRTKRGLKQGNNYGSINVNGKNWVAHRVAWILHNKKMIPKGRVIAHHCDHPGCCNAARHLKCTTVAWNARDAVRKGRKNVKTKTDPLSVRLSPAARELAEQRAAAERRPLSQFLRNLIEDSLKTGKVMIK